MLMRNGLACIVLVSVSLVAAACFARGDDGKENAEHKLASGGIERVYYLHSSRRDRTRPAPLVIVLHGGGGTGQHWARGSGRGFDERADRDGWVVVYPEGVSKSWNDGRKVEQSQAYKRNVDDLGFIAALVDELVAKENVDPKRVYATGISNGGFMSQRLARDLSSRIAAIAPVAANLQVQEDVATVPSRAVSVLAINGTKDPLVPWEGGFVHLYGQKRGECRSVRETIDWWVKVDGCAKEGVVTDEPDKDPEDGTRVKKEVHSGGKDGTEVILYTIDGGGHTWPGGVQYLPQAIVGKVCRDIDASDVIWEFFKRHSMP